MTERVREHWAAVGTPTKDPEELLPQEAAIKDARKQLNKIINWSLNDDKHLKIHQIHDTVKYLQQMTDNILAHPTTDKFRRIKIANTTFGRHVRDAPGGEEFMLASGWRAAVRDHQRHFVYEYYPENDPVQWEILKVASAELAKLEALLAGKMSRAVEDKRQEVEARRQAVLNALEDDKERRRLRFSYGSSSGASGSGGGA